MKDYAFTLKKNKPCNENDGNKQRKMLIKKKREKGCIGWDYVLHKLVIIQLICKYPFSINEGQAKDR